MYVCACQRASLLAFVHACVYLPSEPEDSPYYPLAGISLPPLSLLLPPNRFVSGCYEEQRMVSSNGSVDDISLKLEPFSIHFLNVGD